ncbi:MAG: hypothetical protein GY926_22465 [bacterium]|nr:hypothetical protein [bacterium]
MHLDWTDPPGTGGLPFDVNANRDICCGTFRDVGLTFSEDGGDPLTLFSNTQGELTGMSATYTVYVGAAWYEPCPSGLTDIPSTTFDYVVVRNP